MVVIITLALGIGANRAVIAYHVSATDRLIFTVAALLLVAVALAASWIPARIAGRVDPLQAFRCE